MVYCAHKDRSLHMNRYLVTGARWTDFSSPSQFAFLTAKQGVAVSPLDKREVGLRVNWKF